MEINKDYNGIKVGIIYTFGNILVKALPFLTLPIFTSLLSTSDFGIYSTYLSYSSLLTILVGLGVAGTVKIGKFEFSNSFENYISSSFVLIMLFGLILLVGANFFFSFINTQLWLSRVVLNLLVLQSISTAIYSVINAKYIINGEYLDNLKIIFFMTTLNIVLSLILCTTLFKNLSYLGRIIGTTTGAIIIATYIIIKQNKNFLLTLNKKVTNFTLKVSIPLIPHQLSISLLAQSDKLMVQYLIGNMEAGIYGVAVMISVVLEVIRGSIDNAWTPWFYSMLSKGNYIILREKNNLIVVFFTYLTVCFLLISPELVHIMTSKTYWESIYILIPLVVSIYLNFMYIFSIAIEYFFKKTSFISLTTILSMVINIGLNYYFILKIDYIAAAYATCIARLFMFICHFIMARYIFKNIIVNTLYLLLSLFLVILVAITVSLNIYNIVIRWSMIVAITPGLLFYFYKKNIVLKR
ncbi:MAG: oligosaccharide flippase family protein [Fusobacterium sp.]|nr:oligosaccharide flippase family protein [Fusobacterium sp.]